MPTYEFKCKDCGHQFSLFLAVKDRDKARCPQCNSDQVAQRFTSLMYSKGAGGDGGGTATRGGGCSSTNCSGCSGC